MDKLLLSIGKTRNNSSYLIAKAGVKPLCRPQIRRKPERNRMRALLLHPVYRLRENAGSLPDSAQADNFRQRFKAAIVPEAVPKFLSSFYKGKSNT
jgi:hypothetical protein